MGNSSSRESSDGHGPAGQSSQPPHGQVHGNHPSSSTEFELALLFEQRRRQMRETQARRAKEQEEAQESFVLRKAAEARARQVARVHFEQLERLKLEQEKRREMRETQAWRAREQEEEIRKAAEARARQERQQEHEAMQEQERRRQEEAEAQPRNICLPQVCRRHNTRQGCTDPNCRRLHICRLFLANICRYGVTCRHGHSLTTVHNQMVCNLHNLDTLRELISLQQLRRAFEENDELPETMYLHNLETCYKFSSRISCDQNECNRVHICRQYVAGVCGRDTCKFGHDLHTTHNNGVLSRHRVTKMTDKEILDILREKETGGAQRANGAAAAASSAQNGAVPRQRSYGANKQPSQNSKESEKSQESEKTEKSRALAGLSEELQCPVCLEMFRRATTLGCGHTFCADCLQEVRDSNGNKCPLCRAHISSAIHSVTLDNIIRSMTAKK